VVLPCRMPTRRGTTWGQRVGARWGSGGARPGIGVRCAPPAHWPESRGGRRCGRHRPRRPARCRTRCPSHAGTRRRRGRHQRAVLELQRNLLITTSGVQENPTGWPSALLELTCRRFDVDARADHDLAASRFLRTMLQASPPKLGRAFGWPVAQGPCPARHACEGRTRDVHRRPLPSSPHWYDVARQRCRGVLPLFGGFARSGASKSAAFPRSLDPVAATPRCWPV
jgi:hypothetical protein